jgi:arylsulfatase
MKKDLIATGILLFMIIPVATIHAQQKKRINILFLMSDQHRGDYIGAAGADFVRTPNIDRLAKEGVLFSRAYSSIPSCFPARTSILTGMSPWKHGQLGYNPIPDYPVEGPALFTAAGYRTHAVGKNHFSPMRNKHGYLDVELEEGWYSMQKGHEPCDYTQWFAAVAPGKDMNATGLNYNDLRGGRYFPFDDTLHPTHWTAERAINFLENYHGDEPWLLKVSFQRPHPPFDPPKRWADIMLNVKIPLPPVGAWAEAKYGDKKYGIEEKNNAPSGVFPDTDIIESRRSYIAGLGYVDEQLGRVLDALKARGELENTLILYTADHGEMLGDHHLWRKCRPQEGSVRIPMIIRWPSSLEIKARRGQVRSELVELRDVFPTFLDAAGLGIPSVMDGRSMLDIVKGKKWREVLDLEHAQIYEPDNGWVALTDARYKYIYYLPTGQEQLFDLRKDPTELIDLAQIPNRNEKILADWRARMIEHLRIRGELWVKDGKLVVQPKPIYYGVNFPGYANGARPKE